MKRLSLIASALAVLGLTACEKGLVEDIADVSATSQVTNSVLQVRTLSGGMAGSVATVAYPVTVYVFQDEDCRAEQTIGDITITITDGGQPFNPLEQQAVDINDAVGNRQVGGLGIYLYQQLMDNVVYYIIHGYLLNPSLTPPLQGRGTAVHKLQLAFRTDPRNLNSRIQVLKVLFASTNRLCTRTRT